MTTVTICSSSRFYSQAKRLVEELSECGITTYTPRFDYDEEVTQVSREDKAMLTHEFLEKVAESDAIYVIAGNGYTGRSVCIEIGYATALGKTVVLSEPAEEAAVQALTSAVIPISELPDRLAETAEFLSPPIRT